MPALDSTKPVRVPGIRGSERAKEALSTGMLEIDEKDWEKFLAVSKSIA